MLAHRIKHELRACYEELLDDFNYHYMKSVRIRSFSSPHFPAFGLNTERCGISLPIQSECGKIRTRKTPSADTFHAVYTYGESDSFKVLEISCYEKFRNSK